METILEVKNVTKIYKLRKGASLKAVDNISLSLNQSDIYGLIGPNGAGKSTLVKMMMGLTNMDSGSISILGQDITRNRLEALKMVGGIIETPTLNGQLTGRDNLIYLSKYQGTVDLKDIDEALELVGLNDRANDKFSQYSLGMKQRLGLAQAIMHRPKVLILDEPTNGMDPSWIIKVRETLQTLVKEREISILVSSHILGEMQLLCSRFGIISHGKLKKEVTIQELSDINVYATTVLKVDNPMVTTEVLMQMNIDYSINQDEYGSITLNSTQKTEIAKLVRNLVEKDVQIYQIKDVPITVENFFKKYAREDLV